MPVNLTSDQQILWQHGFVKLNETIVTTWATMIVMSVGAKLITRKLKTEGDISRWQGSLEIVVTAMKEQIKEVGLSEPAKYLSLLGTLFLFVATAVQHHQRSITHGGLGRSSVRQHDERGDDYRLCAHDHAFYLSHFHDRARPAHRHGASLYLQHSGHGLHRSRHPHTKTEAGCCSNQARHEEFESATLAIRRTPYG